MDTTEIASPPQILAGSNGKQEKLNWQDSLPIQRLLDAISSIIAQEYITIAKQNPTVFAEIASPPSGVRNDYHGMEDKK
ncbi:MAG: hypothetical protein AABZ65_01430 [Candidatus Omnitrophota bacterium]